MCNSYLSSYICLTYPVIHLSASISRSFIHLWYTEHAFINCWLYFKQWDSELQGVWGRSFCRLLGKNTAYFVLGMLQCWFGSWWFIANHINENLTKADLNVSSLVCCCLFCRVNVFGLSYKNLKNCSVSRVVGCNLRKAVRLVLYVRMVFLCCQLNMGMAFCFANLRRNGIFVLPTYVGMTFVCS
jgi:hypothetical protein